MKNNKGFAHIFVLILILLAGISGILYLSIKREKIPLKTDLSSNELVHETPTAYLIPEADTTNWKTYRNRTFGFELQYPPTADICVTQRGVLIDQFKDKDLCNGFKYWITNNNYDQLIDSIKHESNLSKSPNKNIENKEFEIYQWISKGNSIRQKAAILKEKENYFIIELNSADSTDPLFDQILSTFKFSDTQIGTIDSKFILFQNKLCDFTFEYPSSWTTTLMSANDVIIRSEDFESSDIEIIRGVEIRFLLSSEKYSGDINSLLEEKGIKPNSDYFVTDSSVVNLGSYKAVIIYAQSPGFIGVSYKIPYKNQIYEAALNSPKYKEYKNLFDQILSTFKFTN